MSTFMADIRTRGQAAQRELHDAAKEERRAIAHFNADRIRLEQLRDAIRRAAFAERDAEGLALCIVTLQRFEER